MTNTTLTALRNAASEMTNPSRRIREDDGRYYVDVRDTACPGCWRQVGMVRSYAAAEELASIGYPPAPTPHGLGVEASEEAQTMTSTIETTITADEHLPTDQQRAVARTAISQSVHHDQIITLDECTGPETIAYLAEACDDSADTEAVTEYWGATDTGATWRVHVQH